MTERILNVQADYPDSRDWLYRPTLRLLAPAIERPPGLSILNQGSEGACTGFALAAAINLLNRRANRSIEVSARMLYEMAKRHDEWAGEDYDGSSLRGAIHGWKEMGVCPEENWPYRRSRRSDNTLTIERAKAAREHTLGAYYRLRPEITDYHAALNETGVVVVSAFVHRGWDSARSGVIKPHDKSTGGHAFAIVGYDEKGFIVQNSWGRRWGDDGCALWTYEDWIKNVMDGWVFRPALPVPQIFGLRPESSKLVDAAPESQRQQATKPSTPRLDIAGHFVHIDDGKFAERDKYWSTVFDVEQTAELVANSNKYKHLLIYGHGGLNSPNASAARIAAMKNVFKDNGVYPFHIMYDTGLVEELRDLILGKGNKAGDRVGGVGDFFDRTVEHIIRRPGTLIWEEMKNDAADAFASQGAGTESLKLFIKHIRAAPNHLKKKIHLVGHSTGAILFAHLLKALANFQLKVETCSLLAPACSVDLYNEAYLPVLKGNKSLKIGKMQIYNLRDALERDDVVISSLAYRKSLLYLVSNAFERVEECPLLGMEKFRGDVEAPGGKPEVHLSNGATGNVTRSTSHGGFDNDPVTMNHVLRTILGKRPARQFETSDLDF